MTDDVTGSSSEGTTSIVPEAQETGTTLEQALGETVPVRIPVTDPREGIANTPFGLALWNATEAFRSVAYQTLIAQRGTDVHRRLDRREDELSALQNRFSDERVERVRAEERLGAVTDRQARDDIL